MLNLLSDIIAVSRSRAVDNAKHQFTRLTANLTFTKTFLQVLVAKSNIGFGGVLKVQAPRMPDDDLHLSGDTS